MKFLSFRGGLDPITGGLWLSDIAHHYLIIAILFFVVGHIYIGPIGGIGHGLKIYFGGSQGPITCCGMRSTAPVVQPQHGGPTTTTYSSLCGKAAPAPRPPRLTHGPATKVTGPTRRCVGQTGLACCKQEGHAPFFLTRPIHGAKWREKEKTSVTSQSGNKTTDEY